MTSNNIYYVYAYIRSKDSATAKAGTPYYIGKGSGYRYISQHRKNGKGVHVPVDRKFIVILESNLSEIGALAIERRLISWWGKTYDDSGILRNVADGGEGCYGVKRTEAHKKILSERMIKNSPMKTLRTNAGSFITGMVSVKDIEDNIVRVPIDDPRYICGDLVGINKNNEKISKQMSINTKGKIVVKDINGIISQVSVEDPRYISGELFPIGKGKIIAKDKNGKIYRIDKSDPRWISGELVGIKSNKFI